MMPQGLLITEQLREIVSKYRMPPEFMRRLLDDGECISYPGPMKVAMCEETFQAGFYLPLHPFIEWLLAR